MLQGGAYPGHWRELIAAWLVYKGRNDFKDMGRLSATGRPKVVGLWIKNAHSVSFKPKPLPNVTLIKREHKAWCASLQPTWLWQDNQTAIVAAEHQDWGGIHVFGVNGLLSMLASLYFWGMSLTESKFDMVAWQEAVYDCLSVIQQLPGPL